MAKKNKKPPRPKARLPKGLRDTSADEIRAREKMLRVIRDVYESYGFEPLDTPAFEYSDALGKFLPDSERPNAGVFSFADEDAQWLSLRYDLTAPLARHVAENFDTLPKPFRRYQVGSVWRNEKPGPGRFREFIQFDADTVGASSLAADAEMCMLAADALEALGIERGDYVIKIWNRKMLDGVMDAIPELSNAPPEKRLVVLRSIDKLDRVGLTGVQQLLADGRKDESGDFTEGAFLSIAANNFISVTSSSMSIDEFSDDTLLYKNENYKAEIEKFKGGNRSPFDFEVYRKSILTFLDGEVVPSAIEDGLRELSEIKSLVVAAGYDDGRIVIDPSVVRGLEYYTGPVFEAELTFETKDEKGCAVRFGSVGGGGRYDGLVARFKGQPIPATGFSIGVSRLYAALQSLGKLGSAEKPGPVVVAVFDKKLIADYQVLVTQLREAKIRAELYLGNGNLAKQFKYADRRGAPCVVIQGPDEKEKNEVQIKDLIEGAKAARSIASNVEWRAERPAQFAVPEDKLVEAVREVLARHES